MRSFCPRAAMHRFTGWSGSHCPHLFSEHGRAIRLPGQMRPGHGCLTRLGRFSSPDGLLYESVAAYHRSPWRAAFSRGGQAGLGGAGRHGVQGRTMPPNCPKRPLTHVLSASSRRISSGFLIQPFISSGNRSLRVVVVGTRLISYWRDSVCRTTLRYRRGQGGSNRSSRRTANFRPRLKKKCSGYLRAKPAFNWPGSISCSDDHDLGRGRSCRNLWFWRLTIFFRAQRS